MSERVDIYQFKLVYSLDCLRFSRASNKNVANWVCTAGSEELSKSAYALVDDDRDF